MNKLRTLLSDIYTGLATVKEKLTLKIVFIITISQYVLNTLRRPNIKKKIKQSTLIRGGQRP